VEPLVEQLQRELGDLGKNGDHHGDVHRIEGCTHQSIVALVPQIHIHLVQAQGQASGLESKQEGG